MEITGRRTKTTNEVIIPSATRKREREGTRRNTREGFPEVLTDLVLPAAGLGEVLPLRTPSNFRARRLLTEGGPYASTHPAQISQSDTRAAALRVFL